MAEKKVPLSIVLRTVDRATAGINSVAKRLAAVSKPFEDLREAFSKLNEGSGLDKVRDALGGVGSAIGGVLSSVLMIVGAIGAAVLGLKSLVDEFDDLGDTAERLGVSVDELARLRFAAKKSGAEFSDLDAGMQSFSQALGQARSGSGKMATFLKKNTPVLFRNLVGARSNTEAYLLLADAMAKIEDPAKRAALAAKTVGNAALAPMLARGAKGITELGDQFTANAGSLDDAAAAAGETADAMDDLDAAVLGVKGALVKGLAPALTVVIEKVSTWFTENRARIAEWSKDLGEKLPAIITKLVDKFSSALDDITKFVDAIGGIRTVALAAAAAIVGPLISAIVALGIALLTTPVGWILGGLALIAGAARLIFGSWEPIGAFFKTLWDGIVAAFEFAWDVINGIVGKIVNAVSRIANVVSSVTGIGSAVKDLFVGSDSGTIFSPRQFVEAAQKARENRTAIDVTFANAPKGMRASATPTIGEMIVNLSLGWQMGNMP